MKNEAGSKSAKREWDEVMRRIALLILERNHAAALEEVERILASETLPEIRSDALGFRAQFKEKSGDLESATKDLLAARSLLEAGYKKYVHELSLGDIAEKRGEFDEAISWYRVALRTCLEDGRISAGDILNRWLHLQSEQKLREDDRTLCLQAAQQSWRVLGMRGEASLADLKEIVSAIREQEVNQTKKRKPRN